MIDMVEIGGVFFNPDRVAYITDYLEDGIVIPNKCQIYFSGQHDDCHDLDVNKNYARTRLQEKSK